MDFSLIVWYFLQTHCKLHSSHMFYWLEIFDCLLLQLVRMALKLDKRVYYVLALLTVLFMFFIGSRSSPIILFVFAVCTGSMVFAIYLAKWVLAKDEGPPEMSEVLPGLWPLWSIHLSNCGSWIGPYVKMMYVLQLSALHLNFLNRFVLIWVSVGVCMTIVGCWEELIWFQVDGSCMQSMGCTVQVII